MFRPVASTLSEEFKDLGTCVCYFVGCLEVPGVETICVRGGYGGENASGAHLRSVRSAEGWMEACRRAGWASCIQSHRQSRGLG